jgi:4-amino-4-deoxy-L-arabinose transferase-like glycosyltransferase
VPGAGRASRLELAALAAITAIAAFLRLWQLGERSLWTDELIMWVTARRPFLDGLLQLQDYSAPAYQLVLRVVAGGEHPSELALRLPSAIFGALVAPAGAWLARLAFGPLVGICAGLALAVNPALVGYAREARPNSLGVLLAAVSTACFLQLARRGGRREAAGWIASSLALVHAHYFGWLCLAAQAGLLALDAAARRASLPHARRIAFAGSAIALASVPSVCLAARYALSGAPATVGWIPRRDPAGFAQIAGFLLGWWRDPPGLAGAALGAGALALALAAAWRGGARGQGLEGRRGAVLCALWLLFAFVAFYPVQELYRPLLEPRYALPALVPLVVGALGCAARLHRAALLAATALLVALAAPVLPRIYAPAPGLRELAAWLQREAPPGAEITVLDWSYTEGFVNPEIAGLAYYGLRDRPLRLVAAQPEARGAVAAALEATGSRGPHVIVGFVLPAQRAHAQLAERGWRIESRAFGLSLVLVARR